MSARNSRESKERRKHGARRAPEVLFLELTRNRGKPLPAVELFARQHSRTFKPGLHQVTVEHDSGCRYPSGGPCSCASGPECRIVGLNPGAN